MRWETLLALAAIGGVGYLLWERYQTNQGLAVVYQNRPHLNGSVLTLPTGPAYSPMVPPGAITPNCQTPCPPGVNCAQVLDGVWVGQGNGTGSARCVSVRQLQPQLQTMGINPGVWQE